MSTFEQEEVAAFIPDSIEPYVGYKCLGVLPDGRLHSHYVRGWNSQGWAVKAPTEARCYADRGSLWEAVKGVPSKQPPAGQMPLHASAPPPPPLPPRPRVVLAAGYRWSWEPVPDHPAPDENCTCGIYVGSTEENVRHYLGEEMVVVKVALWGQVVTGAYGARGQYAYPQEIVFAAPKVKKAASLAAELYGIPYKGAPKPAPKPAPESEPEQAEDRAKERSRLWPGLLAVFGLAELFLIAYFHGPMAVIQAVAVAVCTGLFAIHLCSR